MDLIYEVYREKSEKWRGNEGYNMKKVTSILAYILAFTILWSAFIGIAWFVCFCFSIQFSVLKATGIWVVLIFARSQIEGLLKEIKK